MIALASWKVEGRSVCPLKIMLVATAQLNDDDDDVCQQLVLRLIEWKECPQAMQLRGFAGCSQRTLIYPEKTRATQAATALSA